MTTDNHRWAGRSALITGASSGIGQAVARSFIALGMDVFGTSRSLGRLEALSEELGERFVPLSCDVTQEDSIKAALSRIRGRSGGLHVLVNNAGLGHQESLLDGDTERWREMLEVNVLGLCVATREASTLMMRTAEGSESFEGHIFNLGSLSGHRVPPGSNVYGATKYAIRSLTESLRQELHARQLPIRVSSVSPGFVETGFHENYFHSRERARELYGKYKVLEPEDVANCITHALLAPWHVQIHDILVRSTAQPS